MRLVSLGIMISTLACGTGTGTGGTTSCEFVDVIRTPLDGLQPPGECVDLRIASIDPPAAHPEGGDTVTLQLVVGCLDEPRATFGGAPVALVRDPTDLGARRYAFVVPPAPTLETNAEVEVEIQCDDANRNDWFRNRRTIHSYRYDPNVRPPLVAAAISPEGATVPVDAVARVTFAEDMQAATIPQNVFVVDVAGETTYDATSRTATFVPDAPLAPNTEYRVVVRGGADGVKSAAQQRGFAGGLSWTFVTD